MLVFALVGLSTAYDVHVGSSNMPPSPFMGIFLTSCQLGRCGTPQVSGPLSSVLHTDRCYLVGGTYQGVNFTALAINTTPPLTGNSNYSILFYNSRVCTSDKDVIGVISQIRPRWCQPIPLVVIYTLSNVTYKQPFQLQGVVVEPNNLFSPSPTPKSSGDFPLWAILAVSLGGGAALLALAVIVAVAHSSSFNTGDDPPMAYCHPPTKCSWFLNGSHKDLP